jgi:hypothetical protein
MNTMNTDNDYSLRKSILKKELDDFETLLETFQKDIQQINKTLDRIQNRFSIEKPNTFSSKVRIYRSN